MTTHRLPAVASTAPERTVPHPQPVALARAVRLAFALGLALGAIATGQAAENGLGHNEAAARAAIVSPVAPLDPRLAIRTAGAAELRDNEGRAQAAIRSPAAPAHATGAPSTPVRLADAEEAARGAILAKWLPRPMAATGGGVGSEPRAATAQ